MSEDRRVQDLLGDYRRRAESAEAERDEYLALLCADAKPAEQFVANLRYWTGLKAALEEIVSQTTEEDRCLMFTQPYTCATEELPRDEWCHPCIAREALDRAAL